MYAIESEQPKISRTKLDGLKAFYGMSGADDEQGRHISGSTRSQM